MSRLMDPDEKDVAASIVDWLAAGDDKIASKLGTLTMHSNRASGAHFASSTSCIARVDSKRTDEYEVEITVRRRR